MAESQKIETEIISYAFGVDEKNFEILNLGRLNNPLKPESRDTVKRQAYLDMEDASANFKEIALIQGVISSEDQNSFFCIDLNSVIYPVQYYIDPNPLI